MPIRFIVLSEKFDVVAAGREVAEARAPVPHAGETVNLSERGVAFKSRHTMSLGQTIELFFTWPTELTGRMPEEVRCIARVVHVDRRSDMQGNVRVGATIDCFERVAPTRSRGNSYVLHALLSLVSRRNRKNRFCCCRVVVAVGNLHGNYVLPRSQPRKLNLIRLFRRVG